MVHTTAFRPRDPGKFFDELELMTAQVYADRDPTDVAHLLRIERWGRALSLLGYATAWLGLNPLSVLGIGLGMSCRWMIMAHHVLHRGYDAYPDAPDRLKSATFGRGLRRWVDWCDWIPVKAWVREHNALHHYRLGEAYDPDVPEVNLGWLAALNLPRPVAYAALALMGMAWKWGYYGPSVIQAAARKSKERPHPYAPFAAATWNPRHPLGRRVWRESWLPYAAVRFGALPLLFLPLGRGAWLAVLANTVVAELFANAHSFLLIVPNHSGADVPRFTEPPADRRDHLLRQIAGSVNYRTGGDGRDFLHGWLNYQIEHHLWPDLSLRQYSTWQPRLQELCRRHGVTYRQESVWRRLQAMARNVVGASRMPVLASLAGPAAVASRRPSPGQLS